MKTYKGGCHCGEVTFEVDLELNEGVECNCSHCSKKGFLLTFTPLENLRVLSGEESLTEYRFNRKTIAHLFCKICGVQSFAHAEMPDGAKMAAINIRCLEDGEIENLQIKKINGKDF